MNSKITQKDTYIGTIENIVIAIHPTFIVLVIWQIVGEIFHVSTTRICGML